VLRSSVGCRAFGYSPAAQGVVQMLWATASPEPLASPPAQGVTSDCRASSHHLTRSTVQIDVTPGSAVDSCQHLPRSLSRRCDARCWRRWLSQAAGEGSARGEGWSEQAEPATRADPWSWLCAPMMTSCWVVTGRRGGCEAAVQAVKSASAKVSGHPRSRCARAGLDGWIYCRKR